MLKRELAVLFLFAIFSSASATEQSTLEVYTKAGCGNCAYARNYLSEKNIIYTERPTADPKTGNEMVSRLRKAGYNGRVFMPVIFRNDSVMHPAMQTDSGTVRVSLQSALEYISNHMTVESLGEEEGADTECEHQQTSVSYIVCANFKQQQQAEHFKNVLRMNGYPQADIILYKQLYRVYATKGDEAILQETLPEVRKNYRGSYVLVTK